MYRRWVEARKSGSPLPELPKGPENFTNGMLYHLSLKLVGWLATLFGLVKLAIWAAEQEIHHDSSWYEPCACGLNNAYTRLGLALLKVQDVNTAVDCLRRSWRVHPCPHSVSSGLNLRLWQALEEVPAAAAARDEYEEMAREFFVLGYWPRDQGQQ